MEPIQIIIIIFALFAYSRAILRFKDKNISGREFMFWSMIWISIMVISVIPEITNFLSGFLGIGRPVDIIIYFSIILLFYLLFRVYVKIDQTEQNLSKVVEILAIKQIKKGKKK